MSPRSDSWGLIPGRQITADLTAMRLLGGGSSYEVWLTFDRVTLGPTVAKILRPSVARTERGRRRIAREASLLERVRHPAVVRMLRQDLAAARPHLVLEHLDGPVLSELVRRHGALEPQQYLPLAIDLAAAAHYLANLGVVHLDIKPSNVVMGAPARLIDLSIARDLEAASRITHPTGTAAWRSPEQSAAAPTLGPAADVWGIGATVHYAISGRRPFPAAAADDDPGRQGPPRPLPAATPRAVQEVVTAALAVRPEDRPRPVEIAEALEPVLADLPAARLRG